jgi:hypothetical protein
MIGAVQLGQKGGAYVRKALPPGPRK